MEWNKVRNELLRRGVDTVIDQAMFPSVGGRPVLVGAVVKKCVHIPLATRVPWLTIRGDIEAVLAGGGWFNLRNSFSGALTTSGVAIMSSLCLRGSGGWC